MTEKEKRLHRCCFTGHRPEKLTQPEHKIKKGLEIEIRKSIADGFLTFISGMARGVDIWAAQIVLRERISNPAIHLICAVPYPGFERSWSDRWQRQYNSILESADLVKYISPAYSRACFRIRNEWMVDHSARVIAVLNDGKSGTKNTIDYAIKNNIEVVICG